MTQPSTHTTSTAAASHLRPNSVAADRVQSALADRVLIGLFLAALFGSAAGAIVRPPGDVLPREYRKPAPSPGLSLRPAAVKRLPAATEAYFNDRLPWREQVLTWHADMKVRGLGVSAADKVIIGTDGWLFLAETSEAGDRPRDPAEQCRQWLEAFRRRREWCAARGIEYVVIPTPEKHSVYPEFLPPAMRHPRPATAAERLREHLRADPGLRSVDLYSALVAAKGTGELYYRTDTHWNERGGLAAYRAAAPLLGFAPADDFVAADQPHLGDLNRMLRLSAPAVEVGVHFMRPTGRARVVRTEIVRDPNPLSQRRIPYQVWETGDPSLPRAVLFHDSFADVGLAAALAEHFEVLATVNTSSFDPGVVARHRPRVVVQQVVERLINWHSPAEPPGFVR